MAKIAEHYVKIGADVSELKSSLNKSKDDLSKFGDQVKKLAGVLGVAFGTREIINFGKEAMKLAGEAEGVRAAFERIGGGQYMSGLLEATKGSVSQLELMKNAVQAKNFDIPLKDLASLFQFATKRAQETGQSVDYLVQSIILGIGRKCLTGDTLVSTPNGNVRIDEIKENQLVYTLSLTGEKIEGIIKAVHNNGLRDVFKITLDNGYSLKGTDNHRLYTTKGYKSISELSVGTGMLTEFGISHVTKISYIGKDVVYDVTLPETENFFANGIVSHNSPLILDNLGISAVRLRQELKGVGTETASVADIAASVGKIASAEMAKSGDIIETTAIKTQQLSSAFSNLQVVIGDRLNKDLADMVPMLKDITDAIANLNDDGSANAIANQMKRYSSLTVEGQKEMKKSFEDNIALLQMQLYAAEDLKRKVDDAPLFAKPMSTDEYLALIKDTETLNFKLGVLRQVLDGIKKADGLASIMPPETIDTIKSVPAVVQSATDGIAKSFQDLQSKFPGINPELGIIPNWMVGPDGMAGLKATVEQLVEGVNTAFSNVGGFLTQFFEGFASAFTSGKNVLAQFLDYFKKWALGIIMQIAAIAAAAAVLSIISGGGFGGIFGKLFGESGIGKVFSGAKTIGQVGSAKPGFLNAIVGGKDLNFVMNEYSRTR